jgi:hypothetical protein
VRHHRAIEALSRTARTPASSGATRASPFQPLVCDRVGGISGHAMNVGHGFNLHAAARKRPTPLYRNGPTQFSNKRLKHA